MESDDRMERILSAARKRDALTTIIAALERGAKGVSDALRDTRRARGVTLGSNSAGAAVTTCATAIKYLRRERGNVSRGLANMSRKQGGK